MTGATRSTGRTPLGCSGPERVAHPDVRLDVEPLVAVPVDLDGNERPGNDVASALGKRHARPPFPLGDRAGNPHRLGGDPEHLGPESLVHPQPRVEEGAVVATPRGVAPDR